METGERKSWQHRLHETIYESETTAGKIFDVALLVLIVTNIIIVRPDSISKFYLDNVQ